MLGAAAPYVMAIFAMSFAALSAVSLITMVNHFDPPGHEAPDAAGKRAA
jgi:hypothetical protein